MRKQEKSRRACQAVASFSCVDARMATLVSGAGTHAPPHGVKRQGTAAGLGEHSKGSAPKRPRTSVPVTQSKKKKKKRIVQDATALFLRDPRSAPNGILHFDVSTPAPPVRGAVPLTRAQQNGASVVAPEPNGDAVHRTALGSVIVHERPLFELIGAVHVPPATAGADTAASLHGVPLEETFLMMDREINSRIGTMLRARVACGLPTGLARATDSVRLSCGVIGVGGADDSAMSLGLTNAEREHCLPPLIGVPAMTLAKTRETWRPHGQLVNTHGFAHENLRRATPTVTAAYLNDRARLFEAFFANDRSPAEGLDPTIDAGASKDPPLAPEDFAIYHQLRREHGERFARRAEFLNVAALAVPRTSVVEIERDYVYAFRFPARGAEFGEPPCTLGAKCSVMELARRQNVQIDAPMRAFLLPAELAEWERTGRLPAQPGLCFDCELMRLTRAAYQPAANLEQGDHPVNRFRLRCEKGVNQYDPRDALPNVIHKKGKTGIVGFVPRYSREYRQFRMERRPGDPPSAPPVRMLADVSPNF